MNDMLVSYAWTLPTVNGCILQPYIIIFQALEMLDYVQCLKRSIFQALDENNFILCPKSEKEYKLNSVLNSVCCLTKIQPETIDFTAFFRHVW